MGSPREQRPRPALRMRSALVAVLALLSFLGGPRGASAVGNPSVAARRPLSVLFVGNSLTYVNDVPALTEALAASAVVPRRLVVRAVTAGGATLSAHWRSGDAVRALREHRPDVLILQGQSTEPLTSASDFSLYAILLKAEADSVGARTVLFQTWARPHGDGFYSSPASGGSPVAMQARLNAAYESLARQLDASVARVGEAFSLVQRESPAISLLDGTQHATLAGSYLVAAVVFQSLEGSSPVGATFGAGLPPSVVTALQAAAATTAARRGGA